MKNLLRKICSPILNIFEKGDEPYEYKPLNRKILLIISVIFGALSVLVIYFKPKQAGMDFLIPVIVFAAIALVGLIIGLLGTDRAVAKIWGNRS